MLRIKTRSSILQDRANLFKPKGVMIFTKYHFAEKIDPVPVPENIKKQGLKATAEAGFKIPKIKQEEVFVGRRMYGETNIFAEPKNINYEMRRAREEKNRFKFIKWLIVMSFAPIGYVLLNAEYTFRKTRVKELSSERRQRLDKEYGVDRDKMTEDFEKLDKIYRVSEKKEIEKFNRIGKTTQEFYDQQKMIEDLETQKKADGVDLTSVVSSSEQMKQRLMKMQNKDVSVKEIEGDGYSSVEISTRDTEIVDPRVGGTKIVFDTRLADVTSSSESSQFTAFMKVKQ